MPYHTQFKLAFASTLICCVIVILLRTDGSSQSLEYDEAEGAFGSSDQIRCRWLGICGAPLIPPFNDAEELDNVVVNPSMDTFGGISNPGADDLANSDRLEDEENAEEWSKNERAPKPIPQYVLKHAPLVHLHSEEKFWPSTMEQHLEHISPRVDYAAIPGKGENRTVNDLHKLNREDGRRGWHVYLDSKDNYIEQLPAWLTSEYGIPVVNQSHSTSTTTMVQSAASEDQSSSEGSSSIGRSAAPTVLLIVEKEDGIVDAFWFFFYSYNLGNGIFGIRFGNHVGDWEHCMVRFVNGAPTQMFLSEHEFGVSYTFEAMEKQGQRPVIYSGVGTHAMYATPGKHPYVIPFGILKDVTDKGPLWDPAQNFHSYHYDTTAAEGEDRGHRRRSLSPATEQDPFLDGIKTLTPTTNTPDAPTSWFHFAGHWGGKLLPRSDSRQYAFFSERAYVSGPPGPKFKALGRRHTCLRADGCTVLTSIAPSHWLMVLLRDWLTVCAIFWLVFVVIWLLFWVLTRSCRALRRVLWGRSASVPTSEEPDERTALLPEQSETTESPV
ncbi:MAG: Vacuolar protein sorting-associated protein 62 [Claussenomyces sp. TS43310]|nr:MAG: Vacuolar protein sorting-associated protein 62 [Claussenomyces sp. TS43310]